MQRGGDLGSHHAGVFRIMAHTVQEMPESELHIDLMQRMTKIAIAELTSSKVCCNLILRLPPFESPSVLLYQDR